MRKRWWLIAVALVAVRLACHAHASAPSAGQLRVATFNIEKFPQSETQVAGAVDEIADTHASVIGLQEIGGDDTLLTAARGRLGDDWQFVSDGAKRFALGVLFDGARWQLRSRRIHDDTQVDGKYKALLEVRLAPRAGGDILRVLVVHFVSGTAGRHARAQQYEGLERVAVEATASGERVIVLGDFNATEPADRDDLAELATTAGLTWASEPLRCTAFWSRDDGCPRSRLDHVLTSTPPTSITVTGACATHGCDWEASCPLYEQQISDHCPVVVTF